MAARVEIIVYVNGESYTVELESPTTVSKAGVEALINVAIHKVKKALNG